MFQRVAWVGIGATLLAGTWIGCSDDGGGDSGAGGGDGGATTQATGSGTTGSGTTDPGAGCEGLCDRAGEAGCSSFDRAGCVSECNTLVENAPCKDAADAFVACGSKSGTFECDADGEPKLTNCKEELSELLTCKPEEPPPDCGTGGSGGGGNEPEPTDVADTQGCKDYCARLKAECNKDCNPSYDCAIEPGQCAASTEAYLACLAQTGQFQCGEDGFSILHNCNKNSSVCGGTDGSGSPTCDVPETAPSGGSCYAGSKCNPVTAEGCPAGNTCDLSAGGFECFPPPNDAPLCGACNPQQGPFCAAGAFCLDGQCARYCCTDDDCGCGKCTDVSGTSPLVRVCKG